MGATISNLVFRPPRPTKIKPDRFFYIEVEPPDIASSIKFTCTPTCVPDSSSISLSSSQSDEDLLATAAVDSLCYHPQSQEALNSSSASAPPSSNLRIPAFFLLRRGAKLTILYSHGNAEDLGMMYRRMKELARVLCVNVLAYDYSGYGLSQPKGMKPTEQLCYRNIEAAYGYLVNVMKIPPHNIVLYGRSLGSGPSCHLARKTALEGKSVAGLILHSPFLSIYRIVVDVKSSMVGDMFRSYTTAKDIKCPVFVIHGKEDAVVPFWHGDELLRSFPPQYRAQPFWVPNMGHNNIEVKWKKEYIERVTEFLNKYCQSYGNNNDNAGQDGAMTMAVIPENERYMPEWSLNEAGKFLVNQTWVKHGPTIVHNAVKVTKAQQHPQVVVKKAAKATGATPTISRGTSKDRDVLRDDSKPAAAATASSSIQISGQQQQQAQQQRHQYYERFGQSHTQTHAQASGAHSSSYSSFGNTNDEKALQSPIELTHNRTASILAKMLKEDAYNGTHSQPSYEFTRTSSYTSQYIETQDSWATEEDINNLTFDSKVCIGGNNQLQATPAALALEFLQQQQQKLRDQKRKGKETSMHHHHQQYQQQQGVPQFDDNFHSGTNCIINRSRSRSSSSLSGDKKTHGNHLNVPLDNLTNRADGTVMAKSSHSPNSQL